MYKNEKTPVQSVQNYCSMLHLGRSGRRLRRRFSSARGGGGVVQWLRRWVCRRSNLWSGYVSGSPAFNPATLCKQSTSCQLTFGVPNYITVEFKLFLSDY